MHPPFQQFWLAEKHGHVGLIVNNTFYATLEMGTSWEYLYYPVSSPTIATAKNAIVNHCQQANETYGKSR